MLKMRIDKTAPKPGTLTMTIHKKSTSKESKDLKPSGYLNAARGESVCNLVIPFLSYSDYSIRLLIR